MKLATYPSKKNLTYQCRALDSSFGRVTESKNNFYVGCLGHWYVLIKHLPSKESLMFAHLSSASTLRVCTAEKYEE